MIGIKRSKVEVKKKPTWTDEQIGLFLAWDEVKKSHYYPMLCITIFLGPRPGEVCGLSENDYAPKEQLLTMTLGYDRYGVLSDMKTTDSHRPLPLPRSLCKAIDRHILWKKEMRLKYPEFADNNFLFV